MLWGKDLRIPKQGEDEIPQMLNSFAMTGNAPLTPHFAQAHGNS